MEFLEEELCILIQSCKWNALEVIQLLEDLNGYSPFPIFAVASQSQLAYFNRFSTDFIDLISTREILSHRHGGGMPGFLSNLCTKNPMLKIYRTRPRYRCAHRSI